MNIHIDIDCRNQDQLGNNYCYITYPGNGGDETAEGKPSRSASLGGIVFSTTNSSPCCSSSLRRSSSSIARRMASASSTAFTEIS
uniref:Uncharacterized protein n=1 Tax=Glossina palpalis gambiensis TaxID=67801 RepID=A0A1B0BA32_9MUSC